MSQVLEKPILLDETGQAIAGKLDTNSAAIIEALDDIKDAIGTSSEFIPVKIQVVTPPTKTIYKVGEHLDLSGMVVNLVGTNGVQIDVTSACTFSPANGATLTASDTTVTVTYVYQHESTTFTTSQALTIRELSSIAVTTPPTTTDYSVGDTLDLTGIVVTATYSDGFTANVTNDCTFNPSNGTILTSSDSSVTVSYTEAGTTKTTSQVISVKELVSIAITTPPTTTEYSVGDTLDLTGIVVTATYDDASTLDVTAHCTFSPANGATLARTDTTVTASYTKGGITKTATQAIIVNLIVYGVEWDGSASTVLTRTDSAAGFTDPVPYYLNMTETPSSPFDNIQPWAGMTVVEDATAGTLVRIPKFYYKLTQNGAGLKVQITNTPDSDYHVSPAHMDRGDGQGERDVIYVGKYLCDNTTRKSVTGVTPRKNETLADARTNVHNLGSDIWMMDYATRFTIWLLYIVEYANWNNNTIGKGDVIETTSTPRNNGTTDSIPYHTGINKANKTSTVYQTDAKYRNIENLWTNMVTWIDGIYYRGSTNGLKVILNPSDFSDGGATLGISLDKAYSSSIIKFVKSYEVKNPTGGYPIIVPSDFSDEHDEYACEGFYNTNSWNFYMMGYVDSSPVNKKTGLLTMMGANSSTSRNNIGYRLMKLPNS